MKIKDQDTIAAISSAVANSGVSMIRISGSHAFAIADSIFRAKKSVADMKSHTVCHGMIVDYSTKKPLDEVMLIKMQAPATYTREDVVEIHGHGGVYVTNSVLQTILSAGARAAEPGEFTKRAFLHGRIDLSQAEAVQSLIRAQSEKSAALALRQLQGSFSKHVQKIKDELVDLLATIEFHIDFSEDEWTDVQTMEMCERTEKSMQQLKSMIKSYETGKLFENGLQAVIAGRPNVGKSSLLNELAGKERAIVTAIPGTTRDLVTERMSLCGIPVQMIDCAGLRDTDNEIERIGVSKSIQAMEHADLILYMIDATKSFEAFDRDQIEKRVDGRILVLINKMDLVNKSRIHEMVEKIKKQTRLDPVIISLKQKEGIEKLYERLNDLLHAQDFDLSANEIVLHARHHQALCDTLHHLGDTLKSLNDDVPIDMATIDLRSAVHALGLITGETTDEEVIEKIFSGFCVGK